MWQRLLLRPSFSGRAARTLASGMVLGGACICLYQEACQCEAAEKKQAKYLEPIKMTPPLMEYVIQKGSIVVDKFWIFRSQRTHTHGTTTRNHGHPSWFQNDVLSRRSLFFHHVDEGKGELIVAHGHKVNWCQKHHRGWSIYWIQHFGHRSWFARYRTPSWLLTFVRGWKSSCLGYQRGLCCHW